MKKINFKNNPILAFLLSFLFPGFGMFYLRRWGKGMANLGLLVVLWLMMSKMQTVPFFIPVLIGMASGAWAYLEADGLRSGAAD